MAAGSPRAIIQLCDWAAGSPRAIIQLCDWESMHCNDKHQVCRERDTEMASCLGLDPVSQDSRAFTGQTSFSDDTRSSLLTNAIPLHT
jgi:hypothetical protein